MEQVPCQAAGTPEIGMAAGVLRREMPTRCQFA